MENASKALIMAAEVLLGVMILSILAYLFSSYGEFVSNREKEVEGQRVQEFNVNFTKYLGSKEITAHDIVTVVNLAKENNDKYRTDNGEYDVASPYHIKVELGNENPEQWFQMNLDSFISNNYFIDKECKKVKYYMCKEVTISEITGRVNMIKFEEINK